MRFRDPSQIDRLQDLQREHGAAGLRISMLRAKADAVAWELYGFRPNHTRVQTHCSDGSVRHEPRKLPRRGLHRWVVRRMR